jgi:hypothetical protein
MNTPEPRPAAEESFPMRTVSVITGVNPVTLRAWERRYGLIKPARTAKGHSHGDRHDHHTEPEYQQHPAGKPA